MAEPTLSPLSAIISVATDAGCHSARTPRTENAAAAARSGTTSNQVWRRRKTSRPYR